MKPGTRWTQFWTVLSFAALAAVLVPVFVIDAPWPAAARDYVEAQGVREIGSYNLVSAVYLGYRIFDTVGEIIVLIASVIGTVAVFSAAGAVLAEGYEIDLRNMSDREKQEIMDDSSFTLPGEKRHTHALRTHLLEVVTGVLGPVVVLFGFYIMVYGHSSPGGGFQGGVIIASGIVFLALGNRMESSTMLTRPPVLERIESAAFLVLALASFGGMFTGTGFFGDFLKEFALYPAGFMMIMKVSIGLIVGAGIGYLCIAMVGREIT